MTLRVPIEEFAAAARDVIGTDRAYAQEGAGGTSLSAGSSGSSAILLCADPRPLSAIRPELEKEGIKVFRGQWSLDGAAEIIAIPYVTAVAYRTGGERPGVWLDAHSDSRPSGAVLQACYDDFVASGEIRDVTFEQFLEAAAPTVVEVAPESLVGFVRDHAPC